MTSRTATADEHEGLLDGEERKVKVDLTRDEEHAASYPPGTFRKVIGAIVGLGLAIGLTYAVPAPQVSTAAEEPEKGSLAAALVACFAAQPGLAGSSCLHLARPWTLATDPDTGEYKYVPFWNLIGRELLGMGQKAEVADAEVKEAIAVARAEAEKAEVEEFKEVEVRATPVQEDEKVPPLAPHEDDAEPVEVPLERPEALDRFYAALTRTQLGLPGAITRAMHYGDSAIGNDGITGAIRSKLQARFGDAGHGFHLLGQPNASYRHQGVRFDERSQWQHCFIIFDCKKDGYYGLGGTTFESAGGAEIRLSTAQKGPMGRKVARYEVWYAGLPKGGKLRLKLDEQEPVELETAADQLEDRWHVIETDDGEHTLSVRAAGGGKVRAYGVAMERSVPGVVYDEMSQIGALTRRLLNFDAEHLQRQLARRDPDLLVLMFGGNDMNTQGTMEKYRAEYSSVIQLFRKGDPQLPCLVMAPLDHGERDGSGKIVTRPIVTKLVQAQREVAQAEGCAFFDTYEAMGGSGSMGRWVRSSPALGAGDLSHLTHHGHKVVGSMLYRSLMQGYADYRQRIAGTPVKALSEAPASGSQPVKADTPSDAAP
ncbi:GDSL-type esterase/lipase family protein [Nannocystis punicea]|uniref:GDSL-type esterase/lipase family protein n=1 Tax=Nannocystis punicea TaxID=2995304 RepID=A0ABY7H8I6_9BACT|nr:GDSL-type esterase/lipase family protein [Nannocystis poenicansa]WAS95463.1 GDSL-type esterase/lipase family protein [Nannocystis poenicansa]